MAKTKSYIICGTPRSGSTLLCYLLKSTNEAGKPESYFRQQSIPYYAKRLNLPFDDPSHEGEISQFYLDAVIRESMGDTGCFGARLMGESLENLANSLQQIFPNISGDAARIDHAFGHPKYIYLSRIDKVAQAVSLHKAEQTGLWHIGTDGAELERTKPHSTPVYDRARIEEIETMLETLDAGWRDWFAENQLDPFMVTYEALSASPKAVFTDIISALGMSPELCNHIEPRTAKLADEVSQEWISRFKSE